MKRGYISLFLGLSMALALAGCSSGQAPAVTPTPHTTPSAAVTPDSSQNNNGAIAPSDSMTPDTDGIAPTVSPDGNYDADSNGSVDSDGGQPGKTVRNAVDDAGDMVRDAVRGTGRAIQRAGDGIADMAD